MPENTDMDYYKGLLDMMEADDLRKSTFEMKLLQKKAKEGVGSAGSAIGKRATGRASSDPSTPLTPKTSAPRTARKKLTPPKDNPRTLRPGGRTRRRKTSDADKKTFTDLEQGADIKRKAAAVRKKKDPKNQSLRPRAKPKNATSLRPKLRPS